MIKYIFNSCFTDVFLFIYYLSSLLGIVKMIGSSWCLGDKKYPVRYQ